MKLVHYHGRGARRALPSDTVIVFGEGGEEIYIQGNEDGSIIIDTLGIFILEPQALNRVRIRRED